MAQVAARSHSQSEYVYIKSSYVDYIPRRIVAAWSSRHLESDQFGHPGIPTEDVLIQYNTWPPTLQPSLWGRRSTTFSRQEFRWLPSRGLASISVWVYFWCMLSCLYPHACSHHFLIHLILAVLFSFSPFHFWFPLNFPWTVWMNHLALILPVGDVALILTYSAPCIDRQPIWSVVEYEFWALYLFGNEIHGDGTWKRRITCVLWISTGRGNGWNPESTFLYD